MRIEIKEVGFFGKTVYIFEDNQIRTAGLFSKVVYSIKGDYVCEGFWGKRLYRIDGNKLVEADKLFFPKIIFTFTDDAVYQNGRKIYKLVKSGTDVQKEKQSTTSSVTPVKVPPQEPTKIHVTVKVEESTTTPFDNIVYDEVRAYCIFLNKYRVVRSPDYMSDAMYARFELALSGINDPQKLHLELVSKGFYEPANIKEMLSLYKVADLKKVSDELGIKTKGKKDDVITTIAENASIEAVESVLKEKVARLSPKGKQYLDEHSLDLEYYLMNDPGCSLEEYKQKRKAFSQNDILWQKYQRRLKEDYLENGEDCYSSMGCILERENKPKEALIYHLRALYWCINGIKNYGSLKKCGFPADLIEETNIYLGGCVTYPIVRLKEHFSPSMIDEVVDESIPFRSVDKALFSQMVKEILNGTYDDAVWEKKVTSCFRKKALAR